MKRCVKLCGIVLVTPILLFMILCILIYIPPIQNFAVEKATQYATEATGMGIRIRRISLSFPLDLVVHDTQVIDGNDTILDVGLFTVKVQLLPLMDKRVEVDGIKIEDAAVNTMNLVEGMQLKGRVGELFLNSHGVELTPETAILNSFSLKDTRLALVLADTTAADTTASSPVYWKIRLEEINLDNVSFLMQMPLDTMDIGFEIGKASLRDGLIDLRKEAYTVDKFDIRQSRITYDSGNQPKTGKGLDPSHIDLTDINIGMDSIYYAGNDIRALIRQFDLKEQSGLQIMSTEGELRADNQAIHVPSLLIRTSDSSMEFNATADWSVTEQDKDGKISARLMAEIGKTDLFKVVPDLPEELVKAFPPAPVEVRMGIDGSLDELRLTTCSMGIPGYFRIEADGSIVHLLDDLNREGKINLKGNFTQMSFVEALTGGITIPSGTVLEAEAGMKGNFFSVGTRIREGEGLVEVKGEYNMGNDAYKASLTVDNFNIHDFMPNDSLFEVTASLTAEGEKFDFFSPSTYFKTDVSLDYLRYGTMVLPDIRLGAQLKQSKAVVNIEVKKDDMIDVTSQLDAGLNAEYIRAKGVINVLNLDLYGMGLVSNPLKVTQDIELSMGTDMNRSHSARVSMKNIHLITDKQTFITKDLNVGGTTARDSIHCYVNAGDLTFLFRSQGSIDDLTRQADNVSKLLTEQWEVKKFDQKKLRRVLPTAQLRIFAGADNPVAKTLSIQRIFFDKLRVNITADPEDGLNGNANLYGLRTDSLSLDTINFKAMQEVNTLALFTQIKANDKPYQEAFDVFLKGKIDSTHATVNIGYFNGERECGVDIGISAGLEKNGISLHVTPYDPTLVYRKFRVNKDNYIYLKDDGRIIAQLAIFDKNHTGLHLYSTPDSLAQQDLTMMLNHIDIAEFRRVVPYMPDIAGIINAEIHYVQADNTDQFALDAGIDSLRYEKQSLGNWGLSAVYLPRQSGVQTIDGFITRNGLEITSLGGSYYPARNEKETDKINAKMTLFHLPLEIVNSFVPEGLAMLSGDVSGELSVKGNIGRPAMNGKIDLDSVGIFVPMASLTFRFDEQPVEIKDSKLVFNKFKIFTQGETPFTIDGSVDMADMANMRMDLKMDADNFELLNAKKSKESLVFGKLYVDFHSMLGGTPDKMMIRGNMNIRGGSDFTYILKDSPLTVEDKLGETVTFVNFSDTVSAGDHTLETMVLGGIDMLMTLHIDEGVQCRVNLDDEGTNYMMFEGGGDLSFQYTLEGNMVLTGRYTLVSGEMKYELPVIPLKTFHIKEGSYIEWTGNLMNPNLNIQATERMRASVASEGQSARTVNFDVGVDITNRLDNLGFTFTIDAPDDGSVQNDLAAMSAEEKNKLAVTMLVTGMYLAEGNSGGGLSANSVMNTFLQDQINKMAGSALKTVDLNFGIEQTDDETGSTRTDYNFQFAKRFWNNRISVVIGGTVSTGNNVQQDDSFIDNISLEYRLDDSGTRYVKVFHDKTYENVLDGEVTETGAGIVLRKKVGKLSELFIFRKKKNPNEKEENEKTVQ